jgi:protein-L-isoaspartate(D-aspartate) O-methyltransferase
VAAQVYSVEIVDALARRARVTLDELGITNATIAVRDGTTGWPEHAPYDAITVAAATHEVPRALVEQLAVGGRLIVPVGEAEFQTLRLVTRQAHGVVDKALVDVRFVPLVGR